MYFGQASECAEVATRLLDNDTERNRVARAGHLRALNSGYDNQSRLAEAIARSPVLRRYFSKKTGSGNDREQPQRQGGVGS
jgi:hypothetical protein